MAKKIEDNGFPNQMWLEDTINEVLFANRHLNIFLEAERKHLSDRLAKALRS